MNYVIKHSTKGYFQHPNNWIVNHENAYKWASRFPNSLAAKEVAKTLRSLSGKPLRLEIVEIFPPHGEHGFESYRTIEYLVPKR